MPEVPRQAPVDYDTLAEFLSALGYPLRLELLDRLRSPHTLHEIRVAPHRVERGTNPDRPAAKQTVQAHLDRLVDVDLVRVEEVEQGGRKSPAYAVNPQRLYGVVEELRRLVVLYAGQGLGGDDTGTLVHATRPQRGTGPRLVLVHGVYEGKSYPLETATQRDGGWMIGRRPGLPVALDYDPYVSVENSLVTARGGGHAITDLRENKNGTMVNWAYVPRGGTQALESGDVISVGRSTLLYLGK